MKASTAAAIIASLGIIGVSGYFLYKYYTSTPRTVITMPTSSPTATTIVSPTPTFTVSPTPTVTPISTPITSSPTPTPVPQISATVTNMQTEQSVVLTNSNPIAVLPPATQFYVQITNGQPNSTYDISASLLCTDGTAHSLSTQLTTDSSGTASDTINFPCPPIQYTIKITGPLISNYFEAYYVLPHKSFTYPV